MLFRGDRYDELLFLKYKEVIDIHTGFRLGYVCDIEFDDREGCIASLVTPGRPRFFGLLGR